MNGTNDDQLKAVRECIELLCSACEIARRKGEHTNWPAFLACSETALKQLNMRGVTARTFRIIQDHDEKEN